MIEDVVVETGDGSRFRLQDAAAIAESHAKTTPVAVSRTRRELGLPDDRPVVATGHQALLWHPGILAKYLAVQAIAKQSNVATANLVVDQHADGFGSFTAPVRLSDGSLTVREMQLTVERPGVPMGLHEAFVPPEPPARWRPALPSVESGVRRVYGMVSAHCDAPNAALQMAGAVSEMMQPWVEPMPHVTASELLETSFGRELLETMADDPWRCAKAYNEAVASCPEAGVTPLMIRDDYVELPLWRARDTGQRMRGYDSDVQRALEQPARAPRLFPRALLLTALVRLTMCDLFVHGTGGAKYDVAMERWVERWLGLKPAPILVVSATLRLPLDDDGPVPEPDDVVAAGRRSRRAWHDPESIVDDAAGRGPGPEKRRLLADVESAPAGSPERRLRYFEMHHGLEVLRHRHGEQVESARRHADDLARRLRERPIIESRDWPFPLYAHEDIDELSAALLRTCDAT